MSDLSDFFDKHIANIKKNRLKCQECGAALKGDHSEVAHILPKSKFKSIAMNDDNIIYLCGWKSISNCHGNYDNLSIERVKEMNIFPTVSQAFTLLQEDIKERLSWKDYDRWEE